MIARDINLLTRSAELLEEDATGVRTTHTPCGNGDWTGKPEAKAHHDELSSLARGLRRLAERERIKAAKILGDQ